MAEALCIDSAPGPTSLDVTDEQVRHYVQQGYLVLPGLIEPAELDALKRDTVDLASGRYPCKALEPLGAELSEQQILERLLCVHQPHHISPVIRRFAAHPRIVSVLSRITAAHLAPGWWDGGVKCMQTMLFVKPPRLPGQAWHQDESHIPTRDRSLVGSWIAIDDATVANGCLFVLPGSHRRGYLYPTRNHDCLQEFDFAMEAYGFDDSGELPVEVQGGSVVFFNGYLLHRSRRNRSRNYRRALVNHYMSMNSLLPWASAEDEVKAGRVCLARADFRGVMPVCGTDPDAGKGYLERPDVWIRPVPGI